VTKSKGRLQEFVTVQGGGGPSAKKAPENSHIQGGTETP